MYIVQFMYIFKQTPPSNIRLSCFTGYMVSLVRFNQTRNSLLHFTLQSCSKHQALSMRQSTGAKANHLKPFSIPQISKSSIVYNTADVNVKKTNQPTPNHATA